MSLQKKLSSSLNYIVLRDLLHAEIQRERAWRSFLTITNLDDTQARGVIQQRIRQLAQASVDLEVDSIERSVALFERLTGDDNG